MDKIGIITNRQKDKGLEFTRKVVDSILKKGGSVRLPCDIAEELQICQEQLDEDSLVEDSDIIICLGGDGTFLKAARGIYKKGIPMLGINLGSLGFLAEVERHEIDNAIDLIINDKYSVQKRIMLEATIIRDGKELAKDVALNDVVISRGALSRILHLKTYINEVFVDSFPGDGVIVSSPTGSTAYSLSAGGPIVDPDMDSIILTPICPHTLYSRSFITSGNRTVKVVVDENYSHEAMVTVDGQEGYTIIGGDIIEVKKSQYDVKMVMVNSPDFFNILRRKIYDRREKLKKDEI